jgi:hypothetical protein
MAPYDPVVTVEAGFGFGALATSVSWTTLGSVTEASITRGRSSVFDYFPAASMGARVVDYDRSYDPLNAAGSYAGSLVPNVPIRVTATLAGTVYPRFFGYVDEWQVDLRRNVGLVDVRASDGFKILANMRLPQAVFETVVAADTPLLYWRLGEADGETAADTSGNRSDGIYQAGLDRAQGSVLPYSSGGSLKVAVSTIRAVQSKSLSGLWADAGSTPFIFECWVQAEVDAMDDTQDYHIAQQGSEASTDRFLISYRQLSGAGELHLQHGAVPGTDKNRYWFCPKLDDGRPHHIVVGFLSGHEVHGYVDGQALETETSNSTAPPNIPPGMFIGGESSGYPSWTGQVAHVAIYTSDDITTLANAHYTLAVAPWDGDYPGARIGRILDLVGWPAALRDLDDGEIILGPADLDGMNALAYLQLVAQSEGGRLFMSHAGEVTFHGATALRTDTAASVTFSDDGSDNPYLYGSLAYTQGFFWIYNQATVQRKYGLPQTAEDATSVAEYGPQARTLTGLLMRTDAQSRNRAEAVVYRYKDPQTRVDSWTVNPQQKVATWAATLALELGEHVNLEVTPAGVGSQAVIEMDLEQIRERVTPDRFEFTFIGSPRDPNIGNYFTWGGAAGTGWGEGVWA